MMIKISNVSNALILVFFILFYDCMTMEYEFDLKKENTSIIVLGTIQDAGSPHIACKKECCNGLFENPDNSRQVVSLGLYDAMSGKKYLFEATPDITQQMKYLSEYGDQTDKEVPNGIFLTHAHIGHYTGLMYLGKEAMSANKVPVYAMPKMKKYLETNGPWSQLVSEKNIEIVGIVDGVEVILSEELSVTPLLVPHRDEYSETVGYRIEGPNKSALFIPDIDKWEKWDLDIIAEVKKVDYAFLDATFYDGAELNNRDMSEIPHPFVVESMNKFESLNSVEKEKIIFIHFNHTNPIIDSTSEEARKVIENGFRIAKIYDVYEL
ncbi:MAG: MBL fold metallo-hydrolase [Chlorobiota bacterium]